MSSLVTTGRPGGEVDTRRRAGLWLLLALAAAVSASYLGHPAHQGATNLVTAFLLWRIWQRATSSRILLISLSCISAGFAIGIVFGIALGATGIVTRSLLMLALYSIVGAILCTPSVAQLAASPRTTTE
jgi:ABC-type nitrate/sulfonate/bicarbonate transport system permease component